MAKTEIEYGDRTWNPLTGCTKVSEGCKHCWAEGMAKRLKAMGRAEYQDAVDEKGQWTGRITLVPERLNEPYSWRKPQHVLVEYMGDLFHEDVPDQFVWDVFDVMANTPRHTYQTLTKRPGNAVDLLQMRPLPNVIIGCTIENQKRAYERFEPMLKLARAGWQTWVSYEPALGPVDWRGWEFLSQLVAGGESGPGARPMHPYWARAARDWCIENEVPFFFKQWGNWKPVCDLYDDAVVWLTGEYDNRWQEHLQPNGYSPVCVPPLGVREGGWHEFQPCPGTWIMADVGKKAAGRMLDGWMWSEKPKAARGGDIGGES